MASDEVRVQYDVREDLEQFRILLLTNDIHLPAIQHESASPEQCRSVAGGPPSQGRRPPRIRIAGQNACWVVCRDRQVECLQIDNLFAVQGAAVDMLKEIADVPGAFYIPKLDMAIPQHACDVRLKYVSETSTLHRAT
jgi:hypothetical protein